MRHRLANVVVAAPVVTALAACGGSVGYGKAADATRATRTIDVRILPSRQYDPMAITVRPGETVTFSVVNEDSSLHEFLLGDGKTQDAHEKEMAGMSAANMKMADAPNRLDLDGGETKELTWTFPSKKGLSVIYGSHVPGDFAGGLRGTITVGDVAPSTTGAPARSSGYGQPGDPAQATRVVEVHIAPTRRYEPTLVKVSPGETVTFKVVNDDPGMIHEFLLGDEKAQDAYEKAMEGMGTTPMKMPDRPDLLNIDPGQTEQLTWTFPAALGLTVIYGSHEPGDYAGGLKGVITISRSAARGGTGIEEPSTTAGGAEAPPSPSTSAPGPGGPSTTGTGETGTSATTTA